MKNKKAFDCVEMKHRAAARIHKDISGLTVAEKLDYWRKWYDKMPAAAESRKETASRVAENPAKKYG